MRTTSTGVWRTSTSCVPSAMLSSVRPGVLPPTSIGSASGQALPPTLLRARATSRRLSSTSVSVSSSWRTIAAITISCATAIRRRSYRASSSSSPPRILPEEHSTYLSRRQPSRTRRARSSMAPSSSVSTGSLTSRSHLLATYTYDYSPQTPQRPTPRGDYAPAECVHQI